MSRIEDGYRGLSLVVGLYGHHLFYFAAICIAIAGAGYLGAP